MSSSTRAFLAISCLNIWLIFLAQSGCSRGRKSSPKLSLCGTRPGFYKSPYRIIGGRDAKPGELPWQVYLAVGQTPLQYWPKPFCGGSIIHERWILTAAHCVKTKSSESAIIVAGSREDYSYDNRNGLNISEHSQVINVEYRVSHENYNDVSQEHDIGLLHLKDPIRFDNLSQPICLPHEDEGHVGKVCQTSGWGVVSEYENKYARCLQVVKLPVISQSLCNRTLHALSKYGYIFRTNICTLYPKGGKDTCSGDSGGPLACRRNNGQFVLAGVTSWGAECASQSSPGVFTKVSDYLDWIRDKTGLDF